MNEIRIPKKLQEWIQARERFQLSDAQVQMARELGLNARKLGEKVRPREGVAALSVAEFIDASYLKRFGKEQPELVLSIEERSRVIREKDEAKQREQRNRAASSEPAPAEPPARARTRDERAKPRRRSDGGTERRR